MIKVLLVSQNAERATMLRDQLDGEGYTISLAPNLEAMLKPDHEHHDLVVWDLVNIQMTAEDIERRLKILKEERDSSLFLIMDGELLKSYDPLWGADDFLLGTPAKPELVARIKQTLWRKGKLAGRSVIRIGDLIIDPSRYQVWLTGIPVVLTFKEYELLKFLASNKGKVFTRAALLDKIWGYEYYGGDRTVDVHIRRLRSKVEDSTHTFIDTVRNVGYRFSDSE